MPEHRVLPVGRESREGRGHPREKKAGGAAPKDRQRELEVANAIGRRVLEALLDPADDVDWRTATVVRVGYDASGDRL